MFDKSRGEFFPPVFLSDTIKPHFTIKKHSLFLFAALRLCVRIFFCRCPYNLSPLAYSLSPRLPNLLA